MQVFQEKDARQSVKEQPDSSMTGCSRPAGIPREQFEQNLLKIADEERRRIGHDLHDVLGQELAGLGFMSGALVEALRKRSVPEVMLAEKLAAGIQRLLGHVRTEAWGLIPAEIEGQELPTALSGLARQVSERFSAECLFLCEEPVSVANRVAATNLYRIAQEAVTNAIKHGQARHVFIKLSQDHDQILLRIQDDGVGLRKSSSESTGLGLQIMRFRAGLMNATLDIQPVDEGGVRVTCLVKGNDQ